MTERLLCYEEGDRFLTMSPGGEARLWEVRGGVPSLVFPPGEDCEHPRWREGGDGHVETWWECSECGARTWIAPWVLR